MQIRFLTQEKLSTNTKFIYLKVEKCDVLKEEPVT